MRVAGGWMCKATALCLALSATVGAAGSVDGRSPGRVRASTPADYGIVLRASLDDALVLADAQRRPIPRPATPFARSLTASTLRVPDHSRLVWKHVPVSASMGRHRARIDPDQTAAVVAGRGPLGITMWLLLCEMIVLMAYGPVRRLLFPAQQEATSAPGRRPFASRKENA